MVNAVDSCGFLYVFILCAPALVLTSSPAEANDSRFALWVAFFEIYNECVYDLLQPSVCSKSKKRASLRVCDDGAGNAYVKGVEANLHPDLELAHKCQH